MTEADGTVQLIQANSILDKIATVERCNLTVCLPFVTWTSPAPMAIHQTSSSIKSCAGTTFAVRLIHKHLDLREWEVAVLYCCG